MLAIKYAELVYNGQWFCTLREALDPSWMRRATSRDVRLEL
ncbi:MAG: hypothetical protein U0528_09265 [Anaerolineae bacterium]